MDIVSSVKRTSDEDLDRYVAESIDRATEEGWLKVYYQPVVRTLTGEVCGMEALARWEDPKLGMIYPDRFVRVLEETRQIHKLDMFVVRKVCQDYHLWNKEGDVQVTISFNLSRLDFELCNVADEIEQAITENKVPRECLRIEITESALENGSAEMREAVENFWDRGLRVWMDDFGSGYSSLNILKDYRFDTLKIDMIFLRNFNAKSKEIIKCVVNMAKRIGIHTLAEGVENREQMEFLLSIGCEKVQGYFIGKPMPYDECRKHLRAYGFRLETKSKRQYYHDIGSVNVLSSNPFSTVRAYRDGSSMNDQEQAIAMVELEGDTIRYLYYSPTYGKMIEGAGFPDVKAVEKEFSRSGSTFGEKFLAMMRQSERTGELVSVDIHRGKNYFIAQTMYIASFPGGSGYLCRMLNMSGDKVSRKSENLNEYLSSIYSMFENIQLVDLVTETSETLYQSKATMTNYNRLPVRQELQIFAEQEIYVEDRPGYLRFVDLDTVEQRLLESETRFITFPARTRTESGNYIYELYVWMFAGMPSERKLLCCSRRVEQNAQALMATGSLPDTGAKRGRGGIDVKLLWKNLLLDFDKPFFWKDRDRRFLGVSGRFVDYFGFKSAADVVGKTDEEIGFFVEADRYRRDDEEVLHRGIETHDTPGEVLCKGDLRSIFTSKFPIYDNGEIVGMLGYFRDASENVMAPDPIRDSRTGLLNYAGICSCITRFQDSYLFWGQDFTVFYVNISSFKKFVDTMGEEYSTSLLVQFSQVLKDTAAEHGVVSRLEEDHFLVVMQMNQKEQAEAFLQELRKNVTSIHEVNGVPCTIYFNAGYAFYSETEDLMRQFEVAKSRGGEQ